MTQRSTKSSAPHKASATRVAPARLHQKAGSASAFGGVTKVNLGNGRFTMRKTPK